MTPEQAQVWTRYHKASEMLADAVLLQLGAQLPEDAPECVGIVLYGYHTGDSFKFSDGHTVPARGRG